MFKKELLLTLASLLFAILIFEVIARFFILSSDGCYGTFLGRKLPPERIDILGNPNDLSAWYKNLVVNGKKITVDDLWGITREDELLGYAPLESAVSVNGWWQTNALGALRRSEFPEEKTLNRKRIIVFGDSFTQCSRVPQEESWPYYLERNNKNIEVINFGVDGYNMCQAYLRYKTIASKIDYDIVLLVFWASGDLWRDINVFRNLKGWINYVPTPRFVLVDNNLKLIVSPYKKRKDFIEDNQHGLSVNFKKYLYAYDRFYFRSKYEAIPIIGSSIIYKFLARLNHIQKEKLITKNLMDKNSEAIKISKKIFEEMNKEAQKSKAEFVLIILPGYSDVKKYNESIEYKQEWENMVLAVTGENIKYIDLMRDFNDIPDNRFDTGYDGSHYGSQTNQLIAELLSKKLGAGDGRVFDMASPIWGTYDE